MCINLSQMDLLINFDGFWLPKDFDAQKNLSNNFATV